MWVIWGISNKSRLFLKQLKAPCSYFKDSMAAYSKTTWKEVTKVSYFITYMLWIVALLPLLICFIYIYISHRSTMAENMNIYLCDNALGLCSFSWSRDTFVICPIIAWQRHIIYLLLCLYCMMLNFTQKMLHACFQQLLNEMLGQMWSDWWLRFAPVWAMCGSSMLTSVCLQKMSLSGSKEQNARIMQLE